MKLNQLAKSSTAIKLLRERNIDDIDKKAREDLDGTSLEDELEQGGKIEDEEATNELETGLDDIDMQDSPAIDPTELRMDSSSGFTLDQAKNQLDGMVDKWFELAQGVDQAKREQFLKLGDRVSEIVDVIDSEFLNA